MKRFYKAAGAVAEGEGWRVTLDGKPIRTVGGRAQIVPTRALAEALAGEWADQGETLDPTRFPLRDMADYALDVVAPDREAAIAALLPYAETDTLCYRAEPGEALHDHQVENWEPLLLAASRRYDVHFERVSGIMHRPQPPATLARLRKRLDACDDFTLAALRSLAGLSASLVIAFAALEADADLETLWAAASLEEEWQAELWGREPEAEARRAKRQADFLTAARFAQLASVSAVA